jgi:hypothetical protein
VKIGPIQHGIPAGAVLRPCRCSAARPTPPPTRVPARIDFAQYLATLNAEHRLRSQACEHAPIGRLIDRLV